MFALFLKRARNSVYAYVRVCTCTYWHVLVCTLMKFVHTSMYQYILVCTSIYQYVQVHTSIYWYVPVRTSTSLSLAALFCGRHDLVQGSTASIMKCHDIVHTDRYLHILTCTEKRQVYRILREMALY
jgi:hypothetical protein